MTDVTSATIFACTDEPNDADLVRVLGSSAAVFPIASGDVCFSGIGDDGRTILISVERKHIGDLCRCIQDGRYLHQLQIAREAGADVFVLIAEVGEIRASPDDGLLESLQWGVNPRTGRRCQMYQAVKPSMMYNRFDQFLTEIDYLVGVIVKRSHDVYETAAIIRALWNNFQRCPSDHQSLKQIYKAPPPVTPLARPSLVRRVAAELPGLGWEWSRVAADKFRTVSRLVQSSADEWARLEIVSESGKRRRLGRKAADRIVQSIGNIPLDK